MSNNAHGKTATIGFLALVGACCALAARPASAQVVAMVDFESGMLPAGWHHYTGGDNPWNSSTSFNDPGVGSGQWLTLVAGNADDYVQNTGVETDIYDLSACQSAQLTFDLYNNNDEANYCPDSWVYYEPPAGDCFGVSADYVTYTKVADLTANEYKEHSVHRVTLDLTEWLQTTSGQLSFYFAEHDNWTYSGDGLLFDNFTLACGEFRCGDGEDNDHDGYADCDDTDCQQDYDGDGASFCGGDCDDADPAMHASDLDGDGYSPCDGDCDDELKQRNPHDLDLDGFSTCEGDCRDVDSAVSPGAIELCDDGYDNDCDGFRDEEDDDCWLAPPVPAVEQGEDWGVGCSVGREPGGWMPGALLLAMACGWRMRRTRSNT